jgi:hypothetical protein
VVQRCQVDRKRNVHEHLPEHARPRMAAVLNEAYALDDADQAKALLAA